MKVYTMMVDNSINTKNICIYLSPQRNFFGPAKGWAEIAKTPQCIYCYQMKPEFTCYNLFDNLDAIG
jgi:hypothetical protein